jgi:glycosyltransferase involved in cell wall biosynthesis
MKKDKALPLFANTNKELCVVVTVTNWNEPPRIRHEISLQLARRYNVLYIQLYQTAGVVRPVKNISDNFIVDKAGFGFRGMGRLFKYLPILQTAYNKLVARQIERKLKKFTSNEFTTLVNFQYDFPEVNEIASLNKTIYFCNDDFVNQDVYCSVAEVRRKDKLQSKVVELSDEVITVSYPLKETLERYGKNVNVILSGHSFDLSISRNFEICKRQTINVCYMGFLNNGIAIDWLEFILQNEKIHLTVIGPIEVPAFKVNVSKCKNFTHIKHLTGENLQREMLKHDVMLMPYSSPIENMVTSVPAKLFQYLAVGKPIVSSSLQNLIYLPDGFVYKSKNKEEFLESIMKSVSYDNECLKESRISYSSQHTWDARGNELFKMLAK